MLKAVEADINAVDENARPFYTEKDGKYYLQVTPAEGLALENVAGLKGALESERTRHSDARRQANEAAKMLEAFGDLDPVAARAALAAPAAPDVEAEVARRLETLRAGIAAAASTEAIAAKTELETTRGTLKAREAQIDKLVKAATIATELDRLGPLDEARDVLVMLAGQNVTMQEHEGEMRPVVMDRMGQPKVDAQGVPVSIRKFMEGLRDERAVLFKPTKQIAGLGTSPNDRTTRGGPGSTGPNPWSKATRNLTQQVMIQERNPALAARLRAEAV